MVTNNMFSQKYRDEVIKDLFESMEQLDRIELQNISIQQKQEINLWKYVQSTFLIVNFVSMSFLIYFSGTFMHLLSLGLYSEIHRQSALFFFMIFVISALFILYLFFKRLALSDIYKKQNEERLDSLLNK